MKYKVCDTCKTNPAVIFYQGAENGLCILCAWKHDFPQARELLTRLGISESDLEQINRDTIRDLQDMPDEDGDKQ